MRVGLYSMVGVVIVMAAVIVTTRTADEPAASSARTSTTIDRPAESVPPTTKGPERASSYMDVGAAGRCVLSMEPTDIRRQDRPGHSSAHWFADCGPSTTFSFTAPAGTFVVASAWNPETDVAYHAGNSTFDARCEDGALLSTVEREQERGLSTMVVSNDWPGPMAVTCTVVITLPKPQPLFLFTVVDSPTFVVDGELES